MPAERTQAEFAAEARADGLDLGPARISAINQRGHFGLPPRGAPAIPALAAIFAVLGGIGAEQASKRTTPLQGDFLHVPSGVYVEVDELQHFTTARIATLNLYPAGSPLGFAIDVYREMCVTLSPRADRAFAHKSAVALGHPPVVRIPAHDDNGAAAYLRNRELLHAATSPNSCPHPGL